MCLYMTHFAQDIQNLRSRCDWYTWLVDNGEPGYSDLLQSLRRSLGLCLPAPMSAVWPGWGFAQPKTGIGLWGRHFSLHIWSIMDYMGKQIWVFFVAHEELLLETVALIR